MSADFCELTSPWQKESGVEFGRNVNSQASAPDTRVLVSQFYFFATAAMVDVPRFGAVRGACGP